MDIMCGYYLQKRAFLSWEALELFTLFVPVLLYLLCQTSAWGGDNGSPVRSALFVR